jgi:3D (Asp-Asp-Asp) domain-containing protein
MGKERVTFEGFNDSNDAVMAADAQVIALGDIVG